jgi:hypothetical protein
MKLIANIERFNTGSTKMVKLTFPVGSSGFCPERYIVRNIGPRPWTEMSYWKNGQPIRVYAK